jgi:hypothetical protein
MANLDANVYVVHIMIVIISRVATVFVATF